MGFKTPLIRPAISAPSNSHDFLEHGLRHDNDDWKPCPLLYLFATHSLKTRHQTLVPSGSPWRYNFYFPDNAKNMKKTHDSIYSNSFPPTEYVTSNGLPSLTEHLRTSEWPDRSTGHHGTPGPNAPLGWPTQYLEARWICQPVGTMGPMGLAFPWDVFV